MKKNTVFVLIYSLFLTMQGLFGQTNGGAIEGTVSDKETGEKLPGASVYIKSLERGQAADEQGRFAFRDLAFGEYILHVSFMGYHLQEIPVLVTPNEPARIQIHLEPEATSLSEIAVTAKSEARQRKEEGMPVTVVNMSSLQGTVSNISDILSKTVGMTIRVSGGVGSASRVSVRGLEGKRIGFF
ncbi:MAG TPA: TonB-dependent receptor, partial [Porphyromonadaceae bacterium]|nr:TonB-dependent receptor [Porphyromonadaceae bacterium]